MTHTVYGLDYETIADLRSYSDAQSYIDKLSDSGFPVENTRIVGIGLHSVEQVTGRMTIGRAAAISAFHGACMGLATGLLMMIFLPVPIFSVLLTAILIGAVFAAILGGVDHALKRGKADYTSVFSTKASRYEIQVVSGLAMRAKDILRLT